MVGFLNTLCGPNSSNLKVKDRERYSFDPTQLVLWICSILLRAWTQDSAHGVSAEAGKGEGFVECLATHPDYSQATMTKCLSVLQKGAMSEAEVGRFSGMLEQVSWCEGEGGGAGVDLAGKGVGVVQYLHVPTTSSSWQHC